MRVDSHQHFWRYNNRDYPWMTSEMDDLRRDFLPSDLASLLPSIDFHASVAVQARRMIEETAWLLDLAVHNSFIRGVVGWVDFESPDLNAQLDVFAAHPKLKGVRELVHDMHDLEYATSDVHVSAVSKLEKFDLTYDLLLKPTHIRPAIELVRRLPNQPFVVDHMAKPDIAASAISPWREDLRAIAEYDNVFCKLSGMVTEATWGNWETDDFRPYLDVVVEEFGPARVMIGSDWPVCTLSGSYPDVMQIVIEYVAQLSPGEQDDVLGGTCARFYGFMEDESVEQNGLRTGAGVEH